MEPFGTVEVREPAVLANLCALDRVRFLSSHRAHHVKKPTEVGNVEGESTMKSNFCNGMGPCDRRSWDLTIHVHVESINGSFGVHRHFGNQTGHALGLTDEILQQTQNLFLGIRHDTSN
jgi:hypothetical protein